MDLDKIAAGLRKRGKYEATDIGIQLTRRFWWPVMRAWLVCVLPLIALCLAWSLATELFWLPLVVAWWLKPLFDRVPLYVLSRAFFGAVPRLGPAIRAAFFDGPTKDLVADLTWRRFSPFRGLTMPVRELEGLESAFVAGRIKTLLRDGVQGPAIALFYAAWAVEWIAVVGLGVLLVLVIPQEAGFDLEASLDVLFSDAIDAPLVETLGFGAWTVALSLVEPFFVGGSFGLYINRRIGLEGWDIELAFRRLARRLSDQARGMASRAAATLLAGVAALGLVATAAPPAVAQPARPPAEDGYADDGYADDAYADDAYADDAAASTMTDDDVEALVADLEAREAGPQAQIETILADPAFGSTRTEEQWKLREDIDWDEEEEASGEAPGFLDSLGSGLAALFEVLLWAIAAVVVVAALGFIVSRVRMPEVTREAAERDRQAVVTTLADEMQAEAPLPADVAGEAARMWQAGRHHEALSVLYRGTIVSLQTRYGVTIDPSATARECVRRTRAAGGPADYVRRVGNAWTATVYARRRVDDAEARALFESWPGHFAQPGRPT